MLPTFRVPFMPAGKAPHRGADAVKACYLMCSHGGCPACAPANQPIEWPSDKFADPHGVSPGSPAISAEFNSSPG
jgi:hypothetical protein